MNLAIIKYNAGNIESVKFALNRIGIEPFVTDDKEKILGADKVLFPGVGEASTAMQYLKEHGLDKLLVSLKQPVLGICLGMQLMCDFSEEGEVKCLGIFNKRVKHFSPIRHGRVNNEGGADSKIPQIGWNNIYNLKGPLFKGISDKEFVYFVHSYYVELGENTIGTTKYITEYSSALQKNNFYAAQFHPEKSAEAGERVLRNFVNIK